MHPSTKSSFLALLFLGASLFAACAEGHRWGYRRYASRCTAIEDRIDRDRDSIDKIEATGGHRDALRWYREDLADAQRDLDSCRRYGS
jgi:hypothetical protein